MLERQMADNVERLRKSKETARDSIERSRQLVAASKKAIEARYIAPAAYQGSYTKTG